MAAQWSQNHILVSFIIIINTLTEVAVITLISSLIELELNLISSVIYFDRESITFLFSSSHRTIPTSIKTCFWVICHCLHCECRMMMLHFFLRWKMVRDDAFFVDFQCTVLKLVSQTVLNSIQKTTFLSKEFLSTFSTQFVCVKYCWFLRYAIRHVYLRRKVLNLKIVDGSPKFKKSRLSWRNHDYLQEILIVFRKPWSCS